MVIWRSACVYACRAVATIAFETKTFAGAIVNVEKRLEMSLHNTSRFVNEFLFVACCVKFKYHCTCDTDNIFDLIHLRKNYRSLQIFCIYFQCIDFQIHRL